MSDENFRFRIDEGGQKDESLEVTYSLYFRIAD